MNQFFLEKIDILSLPYLSFIACETYVSLGFSNLYAQIKSYTRCFILLSVGLLLRKYLSFPIFFHLFIFFSLCLFLIFVYSPKQSLKIFLQLSIWPVRIMFLFFISLYRKVTEPLFHSFMYSLLSLLSSIYPLPAMHNIL